MPNVISTRFLAVRTRGETLDWKYFPLTTMAPPFRDSVMENSMTQTRQKVPV